jgi:ribonuclease D
MTPHRLPPPTIVETIPDLEAVAADIARSSRIGVDIESDGFYVYHEKVCLLQISNEDEDFVIDPLAVQDLSPLGPVFRDPNVEKIFHAGEYDILCLKRDYGFKIVSVFDTMIATRTLGSQRLGLAPLIEEHFGFRPSKKLQRANWGKRPLTPEQIQYARLDTHYLLSLRDLLHEKLSAKGVLEDALDEFRRLELLEPNARVFDPDAFWSLSRARELSPAKRAVLKALYRYREEKSAQLDRAPFRVLPEELLVRLAQASPRSAEALKSFGGMTSYLSSHFGPELLAAIEKGLASPPIDKPPERSHGNRWDSDTLRRYEALRAWRNQQATARGVNPVVVLATEELRKLAQAPRDGKEPEAWLEVLSEYKRRLYGEQLKGLLQTPLQPAKGRRRRRMRAQVRHPG